MRNIWIIMVREFRERVYKKSFIITTILMPVFTLGLMIVPTLIMLYAKGDTKVIYVIDESGVIAPKLESNNDVEYKISDRDLSETLKLSLDNEDFGTLYIGDDVVNNPNNIRLYTNSSSSILIEEIISENIKNIIKDERLKAYNIENIGDILSVDLHIATFRNDNSDEHGTATSSIVSGTIGLALGLVLYMFLLLYGSIVMQSIIEEKNSRILEVMVSTVRPFDMMMGKILGVASVAATQILIWGALMLSASAVVMPMIIPNDILASLETAQGIGNDLTSSALNTDISPEMIATMSSMLDVKYIGSIFGALLLFMVGGFLLYSAMFAAVGASVDSPQDSQQLSTPITIPIIAALVISMVTMSNPDAPIVVWCSMIPFTSPIVMMTRIPNGGVPLYEIILSLLILYATFGAVVWGAAKIYKIGIFMHGKKPSFKDLWQWLKY